MASEAAGAVHAAVAAAAPGDVSSGAAASVTASLSAAPAAEEHFDVLDEAGAKTGATAPRSEVHRRGLFHRAVHTWLFCPSSGELLLQQRAACKDSWPLRWDISSAGHLSAGDESRSAAVRELEEELGLRFPASRFEFLFTHLEKLESIQRGKPFINNEFNDVYLVAISADERTALDPAAAIVAPLAALQDSATPEEGAAAAAAANTSGSTSSSLATSVDSTLSFRLQESEVCAVKWLHWSEVQAMYERGDASIVPTSDFGSYRRLFDRLKEWSSHA